MGDPASDLATLQQGVDIALSLTLLEAVFGHDLVHEIVLAVERGQVLLGELAPLRSDLLKKSYKTKARENYQMQHKYFQ